MTPDEAGRFYEDDEDPQGVWARYHAGPHGITGPPDGWDAAAQVRWGRAYIDAKYGRGGVVERAAQGDDSVPLLLSGGCDYVLTDAQLKRFADAARKPPRLPLSRRTRLRLRITRIRDRAAIWLVDHGHYDAALWLWHGRSKR